MLSTANQKQSGILASVSLAQFILESGYGRARFVGTDVNVDRKIGLLTKSYGEISQFHQGAGEDSILDVFKLLQDIPNQSLLVIDEVENSLHPQAQRRFIRYLIALVPGSGKRQSFAPRRVLRHELADSVHRVLSLGGFDDDLVMNMGHDVQTVCLDPCHGFRKNVTGNRLCGVLDKPTGVSFLSAPLVVLPHALVGQAHAAEAIRLLLGVQIRQLSSGRKHHPECAGGKSKSDLADLLFLMGLEGGYVL